MISAIAMPFFNIPLILRIFNRRTSADISLVWVTGVWICVVGMLPSSLLSSDPVLAAFGVLNAVFFTVAFCVVLYFHPAIKKKNR